MATENKRQMSKLSSSYVAVGVILITLMSILGLSTFMRINEIRIDGTSFYTIEEIVEASGLSPGDNLFLVNPQNISRKIREELPFVSSARIKRVLPDAILIEIAESPAIGIVTFSGERYIVDSEGRVLAMYTGDEVTLQGVEVDDLIEVRGLELETATVGSTLRSEFGAETKLQNMQDILAAMEREGLINDVSYLDVSNSSNLHFGYLGRYRVVLGERRNLRHKIELLPSSVEQIAHRYPNTPGDINMTDVTDVTSEVKFRPSQ